MNYPSSDVDAGERVSVVVPTYEDSGYLPRALDSIQGQTYENIEVVVVDSSGSRDVKDIVSNYGDTTYIFDEPSGPAAARNTGIDQATGKYIAFLDADDEWLPEKTTKQVKKLEAEGADFVYSDEYVDTGKSRWLRNCLSLPDDIPPHVEFFQQGGGIGSRTVLCREECFETKRFCEALEAREDPHLWTRIMADQTVTKVEEPLAVKHQRTNSLTSDHELMCKNRLASIDMLVTELPELEPIAGDRRYNSILVCAKKLLRDGNRSRARRYLTRLRRQHMTAYTDPRVYLYYLLSYIPHGYKTSSEILHFARHIFSKNI